MVKKNVFLLKKTIFFLVCITKYYMGSRCTVCSARTTCRWSTTWEADVLCAARVLLVAGILHGKPMYYCVARILLVAGALHGKPMYYCAASALLDAGVLQGRCAIKPIYY